MIKDIEVKNTMSEFFRFEFSRKLAPIGIHDVVFSFGYTTREEARYFNYLFYWREAVKVPYGHASLNRVVI